MRALATRRWLSGGSMLLSLRCTLKDRTIGHGGTGPGGQTIQEHLVASSASFILGMSVRSTRRRYFLSFYKSAVYARSAPWWLG